MVEGTGKVFEQKAIPGEQKEAIRSYEPIKARDREDAIRILKISEKRPLTMVLYLVKGMMRISDVDMLCAS